MWGYLSSLHSCNLNTCPTALKKRDEEILAGVLDKLADRDFPVGTTEIKVMVRDLLDVRREISTHFKNNTPGDDRDMNFKKRTSCKTTAATNIEPLHAGVTADDINGGGAGKTLWRYGGP